MKKQQIKPVKDDAIKFESIRVTTFGPKNNIFEQPFYQYGIRGEHEFPISNVHLDSIQSDYGDAEFIIGNKTHNLDVRFTETKNNMKLLIEESLQITINKVKMNKISFRIVKFNSLLSQIKLLPFLVELFKEGKFESPFFEGNLNKDEVEDLLSKFTELSEHFNFLEETYSKLLLDTHIKFKDETNLLACTKHLNQMALENDFSSINIDDKEALCFVNYNFMGNKCLFFYFPNKENGEGELISAFDEEVWNSEIYITEDSEGAKAYRTSPYLMLTPEAFKSINFDTEVVSKSFANIDTDNIEIQFQGINTFILNCLNHYDETQDVKVLHMAETLFNKTYENSYQPNSSDILFINWVQILVRKEGGFTREIEDKLTMMIEEHKDDPTFLFSIHTLLENKSAARRAFEQMGEENKSQFMHYPIYKLYGKLISESI